MNVWLRQIFIQVVSAVLAIVIYEAVFRSWITRLRMRLV